MKYRLLTSKAIVVAAFLWGAHVAPAQVTFNITTGILYSATDVPLADGRLVQLVASTTNSTFSAPTTSSFVSGDDVVLFSFAMDSSTTGTAGSMSAVLNLSSLGSVSGLSVGDSLMLRWFDLPSTASAPNYGTAYGEYRNGTAIDGSMAWTMLGDGATIDLNFFTLAAGGSNPEAAGIASSAIPEPAETATFAALGALALGLYRRRLRSSK
jgi:hypothetical protein